MAQTLLGGDCNLVQLLVPKCLSVVESLVVSSHDLVTSVEVVLVQYLNDEITDETITTTGR
ncbi:hypothetical protein D3C76_1588640 [compost metagenome]